MPLMKVLQDARYWLYVILACTMVLQMVVFMHTRQAKTSTAVGSDQLEKFMDMLEERKPSVRTADSEEGRRKVRSVRDGLAVSNPSLKTTEQVLHNSPVKQQTLGGAEPPFQEQQHRSSINPVAEFFDVDDFDPDSNDTEDDRSNSEEENIEEHQNLERDSSNPLVSAEEDSNSNEVNQNDSSKSQSSMNLIHSHMSERQDHHNRTWIPPSLIASHLIPDDVVKGVKHFLFFVGHGRGGSPNLGSLIDAHPHVVVATGYELFRKWEERPAYHQNRSVLYTSLLLRSSIVSNMYCKTQNKDNSLYIDNSFMGKYNNSIDVIGENEAGSATSLFHTDSHKWAQSLAQMKSAVAVPIKTIQVVTNPYDNIATMALFDQAGPGGHGKPPNKSTSLSNAELIEFRIRSYFRNAFAVNTMKNDPNLGLDLHQVHLQDLMSNPLEAMNGICNFLGVTCYDWYLKTCLSHIGHLFKDISRSRDEIAWNEAQLSRVQLQISQLPWLERYTFTSS